MNYKKVDKVKERIKKIKNKKKLVKPMKEKTINHKSGKYWYVKKRNNG